MKFEYSNETNYRLLIPIYFYLAVYSINHHELRPAIVYLAGVGIWIYFSVRQSERENNEHH